MAALIGIIVVLVAAALVRTGPEPSALAAAPLSATASGATTTAETPTAAPPPASLDDARQVLTGPATIQIIGDSTGNDGNEWVALWAQHLGRDHRITLHQWLDGQYKPPPLAYGDSGPRTTIWNASQAGGAANWAVEQLDVVEAESADLLILSLGKNNTSTDVAGQLDQLTETLKPDVPQVLILQNPSRGNLEDQQAATSKAAERWAAGQGIPTIDAGAAFTDPPTQMYDDVHPNEAGSRAWADVVADALG